MSVEISEVTGLVCDLLIAMGVTFHIGGSLASSVHGYPRATLDADLVADLRPGQCVLQVQGERLDRPYLERWARQLGLEDSLRRAYAEALDG